VDPIYYFIGAPDVQPRIREFVAVMEMQALPTIVLGSFYSVKSKAGADLHPSKRANGAMSMYPSRAEGGSEPKANQYNPETLCPHFLDSHNTLVYPNGLIKFLKRENKWIRLPCFKVEQVLFEEPKKTIEKLIGGLKA
jgi:hypothetical protein